MDPPSTRTQQPMVTGTSVVALKYADGVMLIADTLGSYGSMAMFKEVHRLQEVNSFTLVGGGGDISDFQYICEVLEQKSIDDFSADDGHQLSCSEVYHYLHRLLYQRRSKINPLWNALIVAGYDKDKEKDGTTVSVSAEPKDENSMEEEKTGPTASSSSLPSSSGLSITPNYAPSASSPSSFFIGFVDLHGTHYTDNFLATGFGQYLGLPLLRRYWRPSLSESEAKGLLEKIMTVLYYRDCRTLNSFDIAKITKDGVKTNWLTAGKSYALQTEWSFKRFVQPNLTKEFPEEKNEQKSQGGGKIEKK